MARKRHNPDRSAPGGPDLPPEIEDGRIPYEAEETPILDLPEADLLYEDFTPVVKIPMEEATPVVRHPARLDRPVRERPAE